MVNDKITNIAEIRTKKTSFGTLRMVYGTLANGKLALRSIRIPGEVSVQVAQSLCISRGGQFSPAQPLNPQTQMLSGRDREAFNAFAEAIKKVELEFSLES
jgi:hypothetical protein